METNIARVAQRSYGRGLNFMQETSLMAANATPFVIAHARVATMDGAQGASGIIKDGAVAIADGRILWVGASADLPADYQQWPREHEEGRLLTPALIDCHTHIVHGGDRAREFAMRLEGASYEDIARAGGGIISTVKATRAMDDDVLLAVSLPRIDALLAEGVGTIEIKSGYGLTIADEIKMLRVARYISDIRPVHIRTTWLAAHALPPEYAGESDRYIDDVCIAGLREAHALGLVDAVDAFCENIGFTREQTQRVFEAAAALGLPVKLHAEQLSDMDGAALVAQFDGLSADHLEYLSDSGIKAMAAQGTVAVLLPGAFYTLRETKLPPIDKLRAAGVPIAVSTDNNPGTSPLSSLILTMNMASTLFRLTPDEVLAGVTVHAAKALGMADNGRIAPGMRADLCLWDVDDSAAIAYQLGQNRLCKRYFNGQDLGHI